jgi:hypothetical protein
MIGCCEQPQLAADDGDVDDELVRLIAIASRNLDHWVPADPTRTDERVPAPTGESDIVWLINLDQVDYVRSFETHESTRVRKPPWWPESLVGYSTISPNARSNYGTFKRRVFLLRDHDRPNDPRGVYRYGAPSEAVDPRTIRPSYGGQLTARAWMNLEVCAAVGLTGNEWLKPFDPADYEADLRRLKNARGRNK